MKLFLLPVLSWTLAISPIIAQKQLSPSSQPYVSVLGNGALHLLEAAGISTETKSLVTAAEIETRSTDLQLDSSVVYSNFIGLDSTPVTKKVHSYPQQGVEVIHEYTFDVDHWRILNRTTLVSDDLGRLVDIVAQVYDEVAQKYIPDSRIVLFPRGNDPELVDSFFVTAWDVEGEQWLRQLSNWNTFDEEGRLKETLSSIEFFQIPIYFLDRYLYNDIGQLTVIESFNLEGGEEFQAGKQEFFYTDQLLTLSITSVSDGFGNYFAESKKEYTYTAFGKEELINSFIYDLEKNDWKFNGANSYVYDEEERVVLHEIVAFTPDDILDRQLLAYTYEADEFVSVQTSSVYDNIIEDWVVLDKEFYYYTTLTANEEPIDPSEAAVFLYPNPTSGIIQMAITGRVSVFIYTLSEKLVKSFNLPTGETTIDLSSLPAGLYIVKAMNENNYYSGKLIIQ